MKAEEVRSKIKSLRLCALEAEEPRTKPGLLLCYGGRCGLGRHSVFHLQDLSSLPEPRVAAFRARVGHGMSSFASVSGPAGGSSRIIDT